jgi:hypothetical protein
MTDQNKNSKTYREQASEYYNQKYETWMPWIEDKYLSWFTKDNKTSYAAKRTSILLTPSLDMSRPTNTTVENLDKTKVTGIDQVDNLQDGVNNLVGGQLGKGGLAQPVGDAFSKEGINRAERGGKDENGNTIESSGPLGGYGQSAVDGLKGAGGGLTGGAKSAGSGITDGAKGAGGAVGGLFGGGKKEDAPSDKK